MGKKILSFALCAVMLIVGYCGYRHMTSSQRSELFMENVEALSRSEISYGYDWQTFPCPYPKEYKKQVVCTKYGSDPNCMPSDC